MQNNKKRFTFLNRVCIIKRSWVRVPSEALTKAVKVQTAQDTVTDVNHTVRERGSLAESPFELKNDVEFHTGAALLKSGCDRKVGCDV